jgi:dihydrofolate reductase
MANLVLTMTMSLDGFFSGPAGELDWMAQAPDPEFSRDSVSFFDRFDRGFIGYPTASGMLPYWKQGKDLGVPGGIRTAQTFIRLGLVDEYVLTVHPVALGSGKRIFTGKTSLELIDARTYRSGVIRARYRPAP